MDGPTANGTRAHGRPAAGHQRVRSLPGRPQRPCRHGDARRGRNGKDHVGVGHGAHAQAAEAEGGAHGSYRTGRQSVCAEQRTRRVHHPPAHLPAAHGGRPEPLQPELQHRHRHALPRRRGVDGGQFGLRRQHVRRGTATRRPCALCLHGAQLPADAHR